MKSRIPLLIVTLGCLMFCIFYSSNTLGQRSPTPTPTPTATPTESGTPTPCCGGKPHFTYVTDPVIDPDDSTKIYPAQNYSSFTGQVAVVTRHLAFGGTSVVVVDLKNQSAQSAQTKDVNWNTQMYSPLNWHVSNLGSVFGVTLDHLGNIYVTASTSYAADSLLATGGQVGGQVYRIDGSTAQVSTFVTLPNQGPALGNIHYSCAYQSFYVSNFADGRIYRIVANNTTTPPTGVVTTAFEHATSTVIPNPTPQPSPFDYSKFAPLGKRVWGLAAYGDRLYYGVWNQDHQNHTGGPNEIWSVHLSSTGDFIVNSSYPIKLEVTLPNLDATNALPTGQSKKFSNPVSDINFGPAGQMLVSERTMNGDTNSPFAAHESRLLEYIQTNSTPPWAYIPHKDKFGIGAGHPYNTEYGSRPSCAGGGDYDYSTGGLVWATGDALHWGGLVNTSGGPMYYPLPPNPPLTLPPYHYTDYIYGIQGLPQTNTPDHTIADSILIDVTGDTSNQDKSEIGDVKIPCPGEGGQSECSAAVNEVACKKDGSGFSAILTVTNNSGQPITNVLLVPVAGSSYTVTPANGGSIGPHSSINIPITITGGKPGDRACFTVTFMTSDGCLCTIQICTDPLPCCVTLNSDSHITCNEDGTYTLTAGIVNNSGSTYQFVFLYPPPGINATMAPDHFVMTPPLLPGKKFQTPPIKITFQGGKRPQEFCHGISLHTEGMEDCCLSPKHCIKLPECGPRDSRKK